MLTVRNTGVLAALLVVGAASVATAQVSKQGAGYVFKPKFTKGSTVKYNMVTTIGGMPAQAGGKGGAQKVTVSSTQKVLDVKNNVATVEFTQAPAMMNGKPAPGQPQTPQKTTMQWDMKANKAVGKSASLYSGFPTKAMKVGETYTSVFPTGGQMGDLTAKYKFAGIKNVGGKQVAQLDVTIPQQQGFPVSGTGVLYLLTSDSSMFKGTFNLQINMAQASQNSKAQPMTIKLDISRA